MKSEDYLSILKAFIKEKIDFMVVGGFAAVAHGVVRVTVDLDLAVSFSGKDLKKVWEVLQKKGFVPRQPISRKTFSDPAALKEIMESKQAKAISFYDPRNPFVVVDILIGKEFFPAAENIVWVNLFGISCPIANLKTLIHLKQMAARPKDLEDIRELEKLEKN